MDTKETLTLIGIFVAIIVLIYNIWNNNRQIKLNKLEEIMQITLHLQNDYNKFFLLYEHLKISATEDGFYSLTHDEVEINSKRLEKLISRQEFYVANISRLEVLANTYLKNSNLKLKVLTYNNMYKHLSYAVFSKNISYAERFYPEGFPHNNDLFNFIHKVQNKIIKKMNLGHKNLSHKKRITYRNNQFKLDVKLKNQLNN